MSLIDGSSRPTTAEAARGLLLRAILPGIVVWLAIVGFGELLRGPLKSLNHTESGLNADLAQRPHRPVEHHHDGLVPRRQHRDRHRRLRHRRGAAVVAHPQWWVAVIPAIAIALQATIFVIATAIIGRPRPEVPKLDPAPPTSSYPSGHVGASTALYLSLALHRGPPDRAAVAAPAGRGGLRRDPVPRGLRPAVPRHAPPLRRADRRAQRHRVRPAGVDLPALAPPGPVLAPGGEPQRCFQHHQRMSGGQPGWRRPRSHSRASRKAPSSVPGRTATAVPSARG